MQLYTIGHSAHPIDKFIHLLQMHRIERLVDVRSVPASRWHPQYNKRALEQALAETQIAYVFAGERLGGRPKDETCYEPGALAEKGSGHPRANFAEIMKRAWFVAGIEALVAQLSDARTAILCSEEAPLQCHRHGLIARYLREAYPSIDVLHIRGNGTLESAGALLEDGDRHPEQLSLL